LNNGDVRKPNWLLRGFVLVSIAVHAVLLFQIAELYRSRDTAFIELEIRDARPQARDIPVPPRRQKPTLPPAAPDVTPVRPAPVTPPPPDIAPVQDMMPDAPSPEAVAWSMPEGDPSPYDSAADYAGMVRLKIESHKQYPAAARNRQLQGRVKVSFVINPDGSLESVSVVDGSRYDTLNQAALAAVRDSAPFPRPPRHLFSGPVSMEIVIVFELM
jgi:periplasmic protein TonB